MGLPCLVYTKSNLYFITFVRFPIAFLTLYLSIVVYIGLVECELLNGSIMYDDEEEML